MSTLDISARHFAKALLAVALLGASSAVHAQEPQPLPLWVDPQIAGDDAEPYRRSVEAELKRPVMLVDAPPPGDGLAVRATGPRQATVAFKRGAQQTERALPLPRNEAKSVEAVAWMAGNVARDESAELLATLAPAAEAPAAALDASATTAAATSATAAAKASAAPATKPAARPNAAARRGTEARDARAAATPESPRPCATDVDGGGVGFNLAPRVGTSSFEGLQGTHFLDIGAVGSVGGALRGLSLGGVFTVRRDGACGAQIAGVFASSRDFDGLQLAGGVALARGDVHGVQLASVALNGGLEGLQLGMVGIAAGNVDGAQLGMANIAGETDGVQLGLVNYAHGPARGLSMGMANISRGQSGVALGLANIGAGDGAGVSMGLINVGATYEGLQMGLVNVASRKAGVQLGLVNYADDSDASIGLLSFLRNGKHHVNARISEAGTLGVAWQHGGRWIHGYLGVAANRAGGDARFGAWAGVGTNFALGERLWLGPDVSIYGLPVAQQNHRQTIGELALPVGLKLADAFSVYVGPSYRVSISEGAVDIPAGFLTDEAKNTGDTRVAHGFGFIGGIRAF